MESTSIVQSVTVKCEGPVATITLNRPETLNALDKEMLCELNKHLKCLSLNDDIKIIILKGNGKAFCSGGDIKAMVHLNSEREFFSIMDCINELAMSLYSMPKLTIAAIHGAAAGLGLTVAMATDFIIAESDSKLAMNFVGIGLIPDGGGHFFLEKRIGEMKAREVIWEGKVMTAQEALELGLIQRITKNELGIAVQEKVDEWLSKPLLAMITTKQIMVENNRPNLLKILELEKLCQLKMKQTDDHSEGINAFIEKRRPQFKGR